MTSDLGVASFIFIKAFYIIRVPRNLGHTYWKVVNFSDKLGYDCRAITHKMEKKNCWS